MIEYSFNDGWAFRPRENPFTEVLGSSGAYTPVRLPHDAMLAAGRNGAQRAAAGIGYFRQRAYEYTKRWWVPEEWSTKCVSLRFEGAYRDAVVTLNGEFVGHRPNGYSELTLKLDQLLRHGAMNEIHVAVRGQSDARWYSGAGLYRNVSLFVAEPLHASVDGVRITTPHVEAEHALIAVATTIENESRRRQTVRLSTEITNPTGVAAVTDITVATVLPGGSATVRQRLVVKNPARWGPEHPNLYTCRSEVVDGLTVDRTETSFGIRSLSADPVRGLRVNGETVKLRGACIHHDNGILGAATIGRADERRVEGLKSAGFNALRSAHQPMSRALLAACDRLGMIVIDEAFDVWREPKNDLDYSTSFPMWWEADVEAMIAKDFNHPSVVFYSIGNEIPEVGNPSGAIQGRQIAEKVRSLDATRLVTNGVNAMLATFDDVVRRQTECGQPSDGGINTVLARLKNVLTDAMIEPGVAERTAESFSVLDVAGYNYLESRYELDHSLYPNRVIVGTESFPASIDRIWRMVLDLDHLLGDFTWTGWDYLGEAGIGRVSYEGEPAGLLGPYPWLLAWCGDIDITGHRRPASYYREIVYGRRAAPYIAVRRPQNHGRVVSFSSPWAWSDSVASWSWDGFEDLPVTVEVYADADDVELRLDDATVGRAPAGPEHRYMAVFETRYRPGQLVALAFRDGTEVGRSTLSSATGQVMLKVEPDRRKIVADDEDLSYLDITLTDPDGNLHSSMDRSVRVVVDGPADLQGLGSARPAGEESFLAAEHTTFDGRALAVVRPTSVGPIRVVVSADGCEPVTVELDAIAR